MSAVRIAVDAMGGDFGPPVIVEGAVQAVQDFDVDVLLVGTEEIIRRELDRLDPTQERTEIINASEHISMGEGLLSFRRKKRSSIRVGIQLVKDSAADAFVSMGNTGAIVYLARKVLGALPGVERPALSLLVPSLQGMTLLIDVGANANCQPPHLVQFAIMGKVFMESVLKVTEPRIALMSIGEEETKGNDLIRETYEILKKMPLNFIGNVEGKDIFAGKAEVIVSDGFTGNVALKVSEGMVDTLMHLARYEVMKNLFAKIGFFLMKRNLKKIYKRVDYSEYGGAQLLGVDGVVVIGHGRSSVRAVKNAIRLARDFVQNKVQEKIQQEIAKYAPGLSQ
ncbi:phosphate acyltransferase PlsX [Candidatus Aminicenantes bacterium AC-334-K16]|jgi:glycerol-3-phosphate acyltransferase PlsX|nr:phosphate acyltransferase PlsX [Candidatus Aminicenantes bacterium AC-334-K16]